MQPTLAPKLETIRPSSESSADQHLRERLLANTLQGSSGPTVQRMDHQQSYHPAHPPDHNIDPAIAGSGMLNAPVGEGGVDGNQSDGKKGKRELSTSKRAAQNRAAQRAFRQRKEGHIKELEQQVKDYNALSDNFKVLQAENYQLRDYIISLQSRLIESQGEVPQPPSNIDISPHRQSNQPGQHVPAPTAPMGSSTVSQLRASAARVIDLSSGQHEVHDADRISDGSPAANRATADPSSRANDGFSSHQRSGSGAE
ncbi:MAG: hypothetical protein LQ346_000872 [Caloplaca aetnensis]|nr:MAG: hypothetical protein LQ346_000872 [Caloplaca aetnensis]